MGNWKDQGVVPDSDDEAWDSQESQQLPPSSPSPTLPRAQSPVEPPTRDIWDFRSSSTPTPGPSTPIQCTERRVIKSSRTTPQHNGSIASQILGNDEVIPSFSRFLRHGRQSTYGRESPDPLAGDPPVPFEEDARQVAARCSHVAQKAAAPVSPSPVEEGEAVLQETPLLLGASNAQEDVEQGNVEQEDKEQEHVESTHLDIPATTQRESSAQGRRSFRPRKPIQEHPYLLENAQYSKYMKTHGMKPLRISAEEQAAAKRAKEDDSQEHEYNDSQPESGFQSQDVERPHKKRKGKHLDDKADGFAVLHSPRSSSPQRHLRASSEQSLAQETDNTSMNDDDDFPDVRHLGKSKTVGSRQLKKTLPMESSMPRKRRRTSYIMPLDKFAPRDLFDAWEFLPSTPRVTKSAPQDTENNTPSRSSQVTPITRVVATQSPTGVWSSPGPATEQNAEPLDLIAGVYEDDIEAESAQSTKGSDNESDSDFVRKTGKRIRGVLPASWLRLDQQKHPVKAPSNVQRESPMSSPDRPRLGLAVKKTKASHYTAPSRDFLDEFSADDDETVLPAVNDSISLQETAFDDSPLLDLNDGASAVEDDVVDWMLPSASRSRRLPSEPSRRRKKTQQKIYNGEHRKHYRQPKISNAISRVERSGTSKSGELQHQINNKRISHVQRVISPPALSIVDFAASNAPCFIKIAARTASKRKDMGRSKPAGKNINLGNRPDNVDALTVLRAWQNGSIKGQGTDALSHRKTARPATIRQPLKAISSNVSRPHMPNIRPDFSRPRKLARHVRLDDFVRSEEPGAHLESSRSFTAKQGKLHSTNYHSRPAQLEADVLEDESAFAFAARKKVLDLVFRKSRKEVLAPTFNLRPSGFSQEIESLRALDSSLEQSDKSPPHLLSDSGDAAVLESLRKSKGVRLRKAIRPRHIDLEAPQFKHANDPLPVFLEPVVEETTRESVFPKQRILTGLGVFGTRYTQHFDIFPLHQDTYFHHTTVLGNGLVKRALHYCAQDTAATVRPLASFVFSHHQFTWHGWTAETSSELGLLVDLIISQLDTNLTATSSEKDPVVTCTEHILRFMLDGVSTHDEPTLEQFMERVSELLLGFLNQTHHLVSQHQLSIRLLSINTRLLLCALVVLRMCRGSVGLSMRMVQMEDVLKQYASTITKQLMLAGLSTVRKTYDDLQLFATRERGIKSNNVIVTAWVILIKVLGCAEMPRAGFWDVVGPAMAGDIVPTADARKLEGLWHDMFTLLPLGEFDDVGVLNKGLRYLTPLQGWSLPQLLIRTIFEFYENDQKQSPNFNEYCRTLLGRCHYLIDQWGWHKCGPIVGTIFDFFGHQDLSHLRNEEVYKSPRFLEELNDSPCLSVEREDRCFHVFLKILAIAIQSMNRAGLSNDIRNLIARCLPNHNRQYSKEQTIHARDLASLRNHHDLLCTLYWAAPPEYRRPVDMIEQLVQPATSHKEACLINLRAWRQLARFVVASGGLLNDYRPFMSWQNNVVHQVLNQYLSAAADVQHQLMSLTKEDRHGIQQRILDGIVATNQAAAKDILHASVMASLDVMKNCPSLASATFSFNINQMHKVFNKLLVKNDSLDWGVLRPCFDIVDLYVQRIERLWKKLRESTDESTSSSSNREFEDAIDFLDDKIVESFFATLRRAMRQPGTDSALQQGSPSSVVDKAVILCARIASVFIDVGKRQIQHFFSVGKYGVFQAFPEDLSLAEKKFVPLFVATLLKNHVFNFTGINCSHFDIWITSLVKPLQALKYETYLTETLQSMDVSYMKNVGFKPGLGPNYASHRHLFACGISHMRSELRRADTAQRRALRTKYERLLKCVMHQMKSHIQSLDLESPEHRNYVGFIREIIDLIKVYGADMCAIDPFYYQFSAEYSPAKEDPQLHAAGILAYGLRLAEGETTAGPQLFYYLYNHFKSTLANGQLDAERKIIEQGMKADAILLFVLETMLPAIIRASSSTPDIWPLLELYSQALKNVLGASSLPREVPDHCLDGVVSLLQASVDWIRAQARLSDMNDELTPVQAHILSLLMDICNALRPTLMCWLMSPSADTFVGLREGISEVNQVAHHVDQALDQMQRLRASQTALPPLSIHAFAGSENDAHSAQATLNVHNCTQTLVREVRNSWIISPELITIRVAGAPSAQYGPQSTQGVRNDLHERLNNGLVSKIVAGFKAWASEMNGEEDKRRGRRPRRRKVHGVEMQDM
ncbi:Mus7/MMS22 family-domain-containing protein [Coniella lustricola]|uniref:Mus7/MMS22 family-domain-containing protein n=1 Tax=Coniella lustricola TaxID=2025994 RepID=A0A2T3A599_9PEZI|nr:Mus7/MMS22 family-domain-containing protein [Coniella lustricola]